MQFTKGSKFLRNSDILADYGDNEKLMTTFSMSAEKCEKKNEHWTRTRISRWDASSSAFYGFYR